ncbi:MAG: FadR family transcriptional regulator [Alistipes sp.]|nr:FadR family transcriptional regulator [Rikenellaceae bacterium]MBO5187861.1 FadR family transcriptional regulator [Alistipes sp.]
MKALKIENNHKTLVDSVEESLIRYFKEQGLRPGCSIPNETELAASLGVGRAVLREALSRFKMTGMVVSRTRKGMVLEEPSLLNGLKRCINPLLMRESTLRDILEFRIALEIGISNNIFRNVTEADIAELEEIVEMSQMIGTNKYAPISEHRFHTKLYEITGNHIISEFQDIIYPVLDFVKEQESDFFGPIEQELSQSGDLVTHRHLLDYIKRKDLVGYKKAIEEHFKLYTIYLERHKK